MARLFSSCTRLRDTLESQSRGRPGRRREDDFAWFRELNLDDAICDSLKTHPTLEVLDLVHGVQTMAPDVITSGTQALADMIKVNTSIHTSRVNSCYIEH